jgi:hypothetical protein
MDCLRFVYIMVKGEVNHLFLLNHSHIITAHSSLHTGTKSVATRNNLYCMLKVI